MEFTYTVEVFDEQEVVSKHACPTPQVTYAEAMADTAWQALMSWNRSWHHDLKDSIYALYTQRKKDAFKISRVDPQIFRKAMSHSMSLLAAQREIHYLRTHLVDKDDTMCACQKMQAS
jgi:hypothetical protein